MPQIFFRYPPDFDIRVLGLWATRRVAGDIWRAAPTIRASAWLYFWFWATTQGRPYKSVTGESHGLNAPVCVHPRRSPIKPGTVSVVPSFCVSFFFSPCSPCSPWLESSFPSPCLRVIRGKGFLATEGLLRVLSGLWIPAFAGMTLARE